MVLPLLAGAAARVGGSRLLASGATQAGGASTGRTVLGNGMKYGGSALIQSAVARNHRRPDQGITQWARENPGEATVAGAAGAVRAMTSPGLSAHAAATFQSVISPQQFSR